MPGREQGPAKPCQPLHIDRFRVLGSGAGPGHFPHIAAQTVACKLAVCSDAASSRPFLRSEIP